MQLSFLRSLALTALLATMFPAKVADAQQSQRGREGAENPVAQLVAEAPRGRLLDIAGRPIAGAATRSVQRSGQSYSGNPDPDLDPEIPMDVRVALRAARTSDAAGRFALVPANSGGLAPGGMVTLRVEIPEQGVFGVNVRTDRQFDVHVPTSIAARAPAVVDIKPSDLAGIVVDVTGQPLEGVQVDGWSWFPGHEAVTGKDGLFHLRNLNDPPTEGVQVRFSKPGYSPETFFAQPCGASKWVVALSNKTWVEGKVTQDGRGTVARIRADQGPKSLDGGMMSSHVTETFSDGEGRFKLFLQPDRYSFHVVSHGLGVATPEPMIVEFGQHPRLDIGLRPGASLAIKVVDSQTHRPVPEVRLFRWEDKGFDFRTSEHGEAIVNDLLAGTVEFQVEGRGLARWWSEQATHPWQRKEPENPDQPWHRNFDGLSFAVNDGEEKSATITVEKDVVITGRVVDADGRPVAGATVAPALTGTANSLTGDTRFNVTTRADGAFEMHLPASHQAKYNLVAHDGKYNEWRQWANGVLPPIQTIPGQRIEGVELQLTRGGTVKGKVVDREGRPCPRVQIRAQALDKLENRYYDPTTVTAADGSFELRFIRPGEHEIQSLVHVSGTIYVSDARGVTVKAGETIDGIEVRHQATREQLAGGKVSAGANTP